MINRRQLLRAAPVALLGGLPILAAGCATGGFLSDLRVSSHLIEPNGSGLHDEIDISYELTRRADVSAVLIGPDGKQHVIRPPQTRAPDVYQIRFTGTVPVPGSRPGESWLRVVPDGTYRLVVTARDARGQTISRETSFTVRNADTTPPQITNVLVNPPTFSPNGDGKDDTTQVSYGLTKKATVRVYATSSTGGFYLIQAPKQQDAALFSFEWDGTQSGGAVLPDGTYELHIEATDAAGNFTDYVAPVVIHNGGVPRAEIRDVRFTPTAVPVGGKIHVRIVVRNTGTVPLYSLGPPAGTVEQTGKPYSSITAKDGTPLYYDRPGVWRVGVQWQNAYQPYPIRWGFFGRDAVDPQNPALFTRSLKPGEEITVEGDIIVDDTMKFQRNQVFWAALEQGGVGFPSGPVGQTPITISY
ncbi:MAG: hypothetical protein IRY83_02390 [Chloroflexi bacterium]|nr:hypothetical protein [Chloroflexota bacterium]